MSAAYDLDRRHKLELTRHVLVDERQSFISHWKDIADNVAPRRPRFYTTDVNKGDRRNQKIVDGSPVLSSRALRAGMMSGITSPARPWFRLTIPDMDSEDSGPVKDWLDETSRRMNSVFGRSNLYNVLLNVYGDIGDFGTAAMFIEEDDDYVIRCFSVPIGSYTIGLSDNLKVETFFREYTMTVRQIVKKYGLDKETGQIDWTNISQNVRDAYDRNHLNQMITVIHAVLPNEYFDETKLDSKFKKFRSTVYEKSNCGDRGNGEGQYLSDKGYDYFPVLVPRWETTGEDAWGTNCPGMEALNDCKQLQLGQRRLLQAIELLVKPPMKGPTSLKQAAASTIPGKITYVDERGTQDAFKPVFQIEPKVQELSQMQQEVRQRISRFYFEDLFLMMSQSDRREITAREIDERHEEKLLALGPVLEQLNQDLLDPLIEVTFNFMQKRGLIPQPPEEIGGANIKVEYISIMAQAQKLAGLNNIDKFTGYISQVAQFDQSVIQRVDTGYLAEQYADICSIPAKALRSKEEVDALNQQIAQRQMQAEKNQAMLQATQGAKNLAQAQTGDSSNALQDLIKQSQAGNPLDTLGRMVGG